LASGFLLLKTTSGDLRPLLLTQTSTVTYYRILS